MQSDFHAQVGVALHSPYLTEPPDELDGDELVVWYAKAAAKRSALRKAAADVDKAEDLPPKMRVVLKKSLKSLAKEQAEHSPGDGENDDNDDAD